jgi:hypothetical protein
MNKMMRNDYGQMKEGKDGFSWTTFFFGVFPALFRGDWKYFGIMLFAALISLGFSWLVFPFIYNKLYMKDLIQSGYKPVDPSYADYLRLKGIFVPKEAQPDPSLS